LFSRNRKIVVIDSLENIIHKIKWKKRWVILRIKIESQFYQKLFKEIKLVQNWNKWNNIKGLITLNFIKIVWWIEIVILGTIELIVWKYFIIAKKKLVNID
jgi:hypothetical protein